jgi:hypothetical protein
VRLDLFVDGELVSTSEESPLIWDWDSTAFGDGEHILSAESHAGSRMYGEAVQANVVDNAPPRGFISIGGGALYTRDPSVQLALTAVDAGTGVQDMELAQDGRWQPRERFQSRYTWSLSHGDGTKTVAVRFWDGVANPSTVYSDSILLDTSPPIWSDCGALERGVMRIGVRDETSGLVVSSAEYSLWSDGGTEWGPWQAVGASVSEVPQVPHSISVPLDAVSERTVRFQIVDRAGNWSQSPSYHVPVATIGKEDVGICGS